MATVGSPLTVENDGGRNAVMAIGQAALPERMMDLMPGHVAYLDSELRYIYANLAHAQHYGLDRQTFIGKSFLEVVGIQTFSAIHHPLRQALCGVGAEIEHDLDSPHGRRRVISYFRPDFDAANTLVGILVSVIDITVLNDRRFVSVDRDLLLEEAFASAPIGVAISDPFGRVLKANQSFATMLGRTPQNLEGTWLGDLTVPEHVEADTKRFMSLLKGERQAYRMDKSYLHTDGSIVEAALSVSLMRNASGDVLCAIFHAVDLTEQRRAARALEAAHAQLSVAMEGVRGGFWHLEISGGFEISSQLSRFISGTADHKLSFDDYMLLIPEEDRNSVHLNGLVEGRIDSCNVQYRLMTPQGERWVRCDRRLIRDAAERPSTIIGVVIDIHDEHLELERSRAQADTDILTGLLNRRGLQHRMERWDDNQPWVALAVDLDGFKKVNDIHGHGAGDHVLAVTGQRMLAAVRESDLVARFGGDEFAVVLRGADLEILQGLADRLVATLREPISFGDVMLQVSGSMGAACIHEPHVDLTEALRRADAALYQAKSAGKNNWRLF